MGGRKEGEEQNTSTSFIHLLWPDTGIQRWTEQSSYLWGTDKDSSVPIFGDLLKIKSTLANVLLGTEFLSMNKIEHS